MADTVSITGTLNAAQQAVTLSVASMGGVGIQIQGSFTGTVTFEASVQGQDYQALLMTPTNSATAVTTATAAGIWTGSAVGMTTFRARMSAFSVGKATILLRAEQASPGGAGSGGGGGGGAVTIADGADVTEGAIADVAVTGDNAGTVSAKLRGLDKIQADVWDSVNHWLNVSLKAGTALIGQVSASSETGTVYNGTTALTPKFAKIAASSSGDNTIVAAVTSKKIRVLAYNFIANGTVNAKFQSGAGGTDLTGLKYCVVNMGICAPFNPAGWCESASGVLLNLNLSAGVAVGGELVYIEV